MSQNDEQKAMKRPAAFTHYRGRMLEDYHAAYEHPIRFQAGERLQVGARNDEYPCWIWCTTAGGRSGWVPERILDLQGDSATGLEAYDAQELSVCAGDLLLLRRLECSWYLAETPDGRTGWVPAGLVELLDAGGQSVS
ncbi:MAG: SH3 domain-containing protein [Anaerolineaceae bacterium]|nr:SH3 domain-containing protein [Anaerolineaceae bacterium]